MTKRQDNQRIKTGAVGMPRREFVAQAAKGVLATSLLGAAPAVRSLGAPIADAPEVYVAYWKGSESIALFGSPEGALETGASDGVVGASVSPRFLEGGLFGATSLGKGDRRFSAEDARVRVSGLFGARAAPTPEGCDSLSVLVDFRPYHEVAVPVFHATSGVLGSVGQARDVFVPVDAGAGLSLRIEVTRGETRTTRGIFLSPGDSPGEAKLRRGVYFIAVAPPGRGTQPDWGRMRVLDDGAADRSPNWAPHEEGVERSRSAGLSWMVLEVDYAGTPGDAM